MSDARRLPFAISVPACPASLGVSLSLPTSFAWPFTFSFFLVRLSSSLNFFFPSSSPYPLLALLPLSCRHFARCCKSSSVGDASELEFNRGTSNSLHSPPPIKVHPESPFHPTASANAHGYRNPTAKMGSIPVIDSVKALSLNGSTHLTNGSANGEFKVRNICCVGAGYVGKLLVVSWFRVSRPTPPANATVDLVETRQLPLPIAQHKKRPFLLMNPVPF